MHTGATSSTRDHSPSPAGSCCLRALPVSWPRQSRPACSCFVGVSFQRTLRSEGWWVGQRGVQARVKCRVHQGQKLEVCANLGQKTHFPLKNREFLSNRCDGTPLEKWFPGLENFLLRKFIFNIK